MSTEGQTMGLRLIVGADEAGVDYKDRVLADLREDPRVSEVIDIGVNRSDAPDDFTKPYPYVGITAGEMIRRPRPPFLRDGHRRGDRREQGGRDQGNRGTRLLLGGTLGAVQRLPGPDHGTACCGH